MSVSLFIHCDLINFRPAKKWYESDFVDDVFKEGGKDASSRMKEKVEDILKMIHIKNSF